ncbi:MAG TPA: metal-dependent transcriptional regulator [Spirochaetota bacterium]|nr:metal-dependent transcriptional regulator [Spirochaetota bacterium]HOM38284.1 metal-dependent transcriptional regulator [Spirochaetota bacterium]HPQ48498.1 metal-dependent transcriptional regulator [Spirochaetota bacterium]
MEEMTVTLEDYIETILILNKGAGVKINDIAARLGIKKSSVVASIKRLKKMNLVEQEFYGRVKLTETGRERAEYVYMKHSIIKEILIKIGVNENRAEKEACAIEHFLSNDTLNKILEKLKEK